MITQLRGELRSVAEESILIGMGPIDVEAYVSESTRRALQMRAGEPVSLSTMMYIEGGSHASRMIPRLIAFLTPVEREFFETFCSVDNIGVRKALRAMVLPPRELARLIQEKDVKTLATFPGIGEATAERIVAKLRRKVGKFALIQPSEATIAESNGRPAPANAELQDEVLADTYAALLSVGHSDVEARKMIDRVLASGTKKKFKAVPDLIEAIYQHEKDQN